jgi:hypothetical protein
MTENATVNPAPAPVREWDQMAHTLFDREAATRQGHSYIKDQETVTRAAEGMTWHPAVEGMSMPFSPGMAIKTLVQALALREVSRVAYDGAVTTHDDYEGPGAYSLVGVETASEEGTWRIVVVDRGTDLVVAFTERQATRRPAWLVVATITIGSGCVHRRRHRPGRRQHPRGRAPPLTSSGWRGHQPAPPTQNYLTYSLR